MSNTCVIVGAGDFFGFAPKYPKDAFVIAADGGYGHAVRNGVQPDLLVGDFDSLGFSPENVQTLRLAQEKDETDTNAAIRAGLSKGLDTFYIYGGTGGRLDHTLANIACLTRLAKDGVRAYLFGKDCFLTALCGADMCFPKSAHGTISIFSHTSTSAGVYVEGLKYELHDAALTHDFPLGVSNSFKGLASRISVREGVLVIYAHLSAFKMPI